jgi:AbrB family looped-hinge helix DNA binding protein
MQINLDEVEYLTETSLTIRGTRRRTTVPKEIVEHFGFKNGDKIMWILFKDDRVIIVPKKSD